MHHRTLSSREDVKGCADCKQVQNTAAAEPACVCCPSILPPQIDAARAVCSIGGAEHKPPQVHPPPSLHLARGNKTNDAGTPDTNTSRSFQPQTILTWAGIRREAREDTEVAVGRENRCFRLVVEIMTHPGEALQQGERLCLLSRPSRRPVITRHRREAAHGAAGGC